MDIPTPVSGVSPFICRGIVGVRVKIISVRMTLPGRYIDEVKLLVVHRRSYKLKIFQHTCQNL